MEAEHQGENEFLKLLEMASVDETWISDNLPAVANGTAQHHAENHPNDLWSREQKSGHF